MKGGCTGEKNVEHVKKKVTEEKEFACCVPHSVLCGLLFKRESDRQNTAHTTNKLSEYKYFLLTTGSKWSISTASHILLDR